MLTNNNSVHCGHRPVAVLVAFSLLLATSCVGGLGGRTASSDPFLHPNDAAPVRVAAKSHDAPPHSTIQQTGFIQPGQPGVVQLAEWNTPADATDSHVESAVYVIPSTARAEIAQTAYQPAEPPPLEYNVSDVWDHEDEYLFDGGDRALPIHYDRFNRLGVDTEDTIAEYTDHLGEPHVKPSNRVAVYAPRFGAVRTITGPDAGTSVELVALKVDTSRTAGVRNRLIPLDRTQRDSAGRIAMRSRAGGIDSGAGRGSLQQATALLLNVKPVKAAEDLNFVTTGRFLQSERARLATGIQAAAIWSRTQSPVIMAQADGLQEIYSFFKPQELVGVSDEHLKKGELRIIKLADRKTAKPGDVITFTIRYDNLGDRQLTNIRIIDNLTPRLEYVEDSGTSDRGGRLDVEDNGEGSLVLKFILDDPLPGREGGVITFQALVR